MEQCANCSLHHTYVAQTSIFNWFLTLIPVLTPLLQQGLDGECYSSVQVRQSHENTTQFKVIKSRDETRCLSVNSIRKDVMTSAQRNCQCTDNLNKKNCVCEPEQVEQRNQVRLYYLCFCFPKPIPFCISATGLPYTNKQTALCSQIVNYSQSFLYLSA